MRKEAGALEVAHFPSVREGNLGVVHHHILFFRLVSRVSHSSSCAGSEIRNVDRAVMLSVVLHFAPVLLFVVVSR